nr:hypothetical protein [Allomuricauda sp.]
MKSTKITIMIILMIIILCRQAFGQNTALDSVTDLNEFERLAEKGPWEIAKQKKGVTLSYRKLKVADTLNIRELSASFKTSSSIDSIIAYIKQPPKIKEWNEAVRFNELLYGEDSTWVSHTTFDIPYPFPQQELVSKYTINHKDKKVIVSSRSVPNYITLKKGINRERYNWGNWLLLPLDNGLVQVTFSAVSLSNSSIPRFIKDPIIKRKLVNSFIKLKNQLSERSDKNGVVNPSMKRNSNI